MLFRSYHDFAICYFLQRVRAGQQKDKQIQKTRHNQIYLIYAFRRAPDSLVTHPTTGIRGPCNLAAGLGICSCKIFRAPFSFILRALSIGQALVASFCVSHAKQIKSLETHSFAHFPVQVLPGSATNRKTIQVRITPKWRKVFHAAKRSRIKRSCWPRCGPRYSCTGRTMIEPDVIHCQTLGTVIDFLKMCFLKTSVLSNRASP